MSGAEGLVLDLLKKALAKAVGDALRPPTGARTVERPVRPGLPFRRRRTPKTRLDAQDVLRMASTLAKRLEPLRRYEFHEIPDNEWQAAVMAVCDSLAASGPLDVDLFFRLDLSSERLVDHVMANSAAIRASARLGVAAQGVFRTLLDLTCRHLVEYVTALPQFQHLAHLHELRRLREVEEVIAPGDGVSAAEIAAFERRYADEVARKLDRLELFGVSVNRRARRYTMSTAYISLALGARAVRDADRDRGGPGTGVGAGVGVGAAGAGGAGSGASGPGPGRESARGHGLRVETALAGERRVVVRGLAGSGKTTLLQWFAIRAARDDFSPEMTAWDGTVPFFLPLRQYTVTRQLPTPEEFPAAVAPMLTAEAPPNWVRGRLASGRALVLVDGVDEVPEAMRIEAEEWLRELVELFPKAHYVVTSRPSAVDDRWLGDAGFATFEVLPMSRADIREFILRWHAAAKENCEDDDDLALLDRCESTLHAAVAAQPNLSRLATSPLLCALLCALHRDRRAHLPRDRHELYDAALDMLLYRRDQERELDALEGVAIGTTTATALLQRIAYWMLRNDLSAAPRDQLLEHVERSLASMPHVDVTAEAVVRHLVARTGLLREPVQGSVDFVHRTFQDYLAAKAAVDENDLNLLVRMAHDDRWHDVVIMAVPHSRPDERSRFLDALLNRGDDEPADREKLYLLAAAGLELATEVDPAVVETVRARAARLVPPRGADEADELALAGEFVLGLLPRPQDCDDTTAALCVRVAAAVGGQEALSFLTGFAGEQRPAVLAALAQAWRRFDAEDYAEAVLRHVAPMRGAVLVAEGPSMLAAVRHMRTVDALYCGKVDDTGPLREMAEVRHLGLDGVDQAALPVVASLGGLRSLVLADSPAVTDLSALAGTRLWRLRFMGASGGPLAGLPSLQNLRMLSLDGFHLAAETLEQLVPGGHAEVEDLRLSNPEFQLRLTGIERWSALRSLELAGWPEDRDLERLRALRSLASLSLRVEGQGTDLSPLAGVTGLEELHLTGELTSYCDLSPLAGLSNLRELHVTGTPATREVGLHLAPLSGRAGLSVHVVDYLADAETAGFPADRLTVSTSVRQWASEQ